MCVCVCSPDVRHRRREPTQPDREASRRLPHPPDGHPGPLAPQQLRRTQHHQAAGRRPAARGGAHHLRQRPLLSAQQVGEERELSNAYVYRAALRASILLCCSLFLTSAKRPWLCLVRRVAASVLLSLFVFMWQSLAVV